MRVHVLDGGTLRPPTGGVFPTQCLLVEHSSGPVLVDAGMGTAHLRDPALIGFERLFIRPPVDPEMAVVNQIRRLGVEPHDVRDIVVTHLHSEHVTGIADFPDARIHVSRREHATAMNGSLRSRISYRQSAFAHDPRWVLHSGDGVWKGVGGACEILPGIVTIPTPGHTVGHVAVAVDLGERWLLHAGDSAYGDLSNRSAPEVFPLRQYQWIAAADRTQLRQTRALLTRLFEREDVTAMCSHLPFTVAGNPTIVENDLVPRSRPS